MKRTESIKAVTLEILKPLIHFGVHQYTNFLELVLKCDYAWRHPHAHEHWRDLRMYQEWCILDAKHNGEDYVVFEDQSDKHDFYISLLTLYSCMDYNHATEYEKYTINQIADGFVFPSKRNRISINNLRWIQKMENKYRNDWR